jgi:hypothetical protein
MRQTGGEAPTRTRVLKALLICGIISFPLYLVGHVLAGMQLQGYSHIDRMVSELSAIGSPSQPVAAAFATVYQALVIAFGIGVWGAAGKKRSLRLTGIALVAFGVIGLLGWFAPMNPPGTERSATDVGHLVYAAAIVLSMALFVAFGSGADGRWFRIYSILTILAALVAGAYTGTQASRVAQGLPTPWGGAIERVSVYGPMLWMLVLAVVLLRAQPGILEERT